MATDKLGLPKITGNMTADVVRDLNALADAVDDKAGKSDGLATLGPDGKVPAEQVNVDTSKLATKAEVASGLGGKVDKVEGKQLSTEDYTSAEKAKLTGIELGANKYTHPSTHPASIITETASKRFVSDAEKAEWNVKETPAGAQAKVDTHEGKKTNPHGVTKAQVGLGNVDNVKQASKAEHDELQTQVTTHLADYTQHVEDGTAHGIGNKATLLTSQKSTIVGAVNELFINVSDGKSLVGGAITDVDENVVIPTNPTFQQLADAIGQISTGKKWASGIATVYGPTRRYQYAGSTSDSTAYNVTVNGLDFEPSIILITAYDSGNKTTKVSLYLKNNNYIYPKTAYVSQFLGTTGSASTYSYKADVEPANVSFGEFTLPMQYVAAGMEVNFTAFE